MADVRLVHLADYEGPYAGSWVPMVRAALAAARGRGWSAEAVFQEEAQGRPWVDDLRGDGVPVRFLDVWDRRRLARDIPALLGEDQRPTILHTTFTMFDLPALFAARGHGHARIVWHLQSRLPARPPGSLTNTIKLGFFGRRADAILCVAPDIAATARRRGAPANRVHLVPNAVDTARFRPAKPGERWRGREELGVPEGAHVLLHYGWDWERKGGDLFLTAVRRLVDAGVPLVVREIGGAEAARELAARLGLGDVVRVEQPALDSRELYATADVFVSSSRGEGMPFATLEALASGVPVAATALAGHEVQAEGIGAIQIATLDADGVAASVRALLERDPDAAAAEALAAREWVEREADLTPWAKRLMALYEDVLRR